MADLLSLTFYWGFYWGTWCHQGPFHLFCDFQGPFFKQSPPIILFASVSTCPLRLFVVAPCDYCSLVSGLILNIPSWPFHRNQMSWYPTTVGVSVLRIVRALCAYTGHDCFCPQTMPLVSFLIGLALFQKLGPGAISCALAGMHGGWWPHTLLTLGMLTWAGPWLHGVGVNWQRNLAWRAHLREAGLVGLSVVM